MPYDYSNPSDEQEAPKTGGAEDTETEEDMGEATALLPKSVLGGKEFKPGEEVVLKIVHIYEDEVEVEYATGEEGEETPEKTERMHPRGKMMMDTESKLDEIAT